jgi:hypothetical protein
VRNVILHIAEADPNNGPFTGYLTFIERLVAAQRDAGNVVIVWNAAAVMERWLSEASGDLLRDESFESFFMRGHGDGLAELMCHELKSYRPEQVWVHSPVILPPQVLAAIQSKKLWRHADVKVVLHDIYPTAQHDGWTQFRAITIEQMQQAVIEVNSLFWAGEVAKGTALLEDRLGLWSYFSRAFSSKLSASSQELHWRYARTYADWLKESLCIAPSRLIKDFFSAAWWVDAHEIPHPTLPCDYPEDPPEHDDTILSVFGWSKFDVIAYMAFVRGMPQHKFRLLCSPGESIIESLAHEYGLPANLTVTPTLPHADFLDCVAECPPAVFLHVSMTTESYGMIVDEMHQRSVPVIHYGNRSAIEERLPKELFVSATSNLSEDIACVQKRIQAVMDCREDWLPTASVGPEVDEYLRRVAALPRS